MAWPAWLSHCCLRATSAASAGGGGGAQWRGRGQGRGRDDSDSDSDLEHGHSSSISGGSDSGGSEEEEGLVDSDDDSQQGERILTRRHAAAIMPKPTLRQVRLCLDAELLARPQPSAASAPCYFFLHDLARAAWAQVFAAAMAEARGRRLHYKTLERLTRMHEEELR